MPDKNKTQLLQRKAKWQEESAKLRKVQISLDFPETEDVLLRTLAAHEHQAPSSLVREILGMETSPPKRARIGVSFNDDELAALALRYGVDSLDRAEIRRKVTEEVTNVLCLASQSDHQKTGKKQPSNSTTGDRELERISDDIYRRFQVTLRNRKKGNN